MKMTVDYDAVMDAAEFVSNLKRIALSVYASKDVLGISLRQAQRYASGEESVPMRTSRHLRIIVDDLEYHKRWRRQLLDQLEFMKRDGFRIRSNGRDVTQEWKARLEGYLADRENLLLSHPSGVSLPRELW
jgi:hypothetical protein